MLGRLANTCRLADLKLARLLDRFDDHARRADLDVDPDAERPAPTTIPSRPTLELDLARRGITTVLWATGYRRDLSWLDVPVLDRRGAILHDGGVVRRAPGLYVLGGNLLRTRRASYIGASGADTAAIADDLQRHLGTSRRLGAA